MNKSSSKWHKAYAIPHTPRDVDFLYALFCKKYMSTFQIMNLFWRSETRSQFGAIKACQRRLRQLEAYGVIRRIEQATRRTEGRKQDLFALDKNSIPLLVNERGVSPKFIDLRPWVNEENNPQIKHMLETTDVQIAWQAACAACHITLETWLDEKDIRLQYTKEAGTFQDAQDTPTKKPIADAFTVLNREGKRGFFWLEVDRANINLNLSVADRPSIAGKLMRFLDWETSEQFREEFGPRPLRKLFITRGNGRMHNMLLAAEQIITQRVKEQPHLSDEQKQIEFARLAKRFLFTTFELFYAHNPLTQPIWCVAGLDAPRALLG